MKECQTLNTAFINEISIPEKYLLKLKLTAVVSENQRKELFKKLDKAIKNFFIIYREDFN